MQKPGGVLIREPPGALVLQAGGVPRFLHIVTDS
jgi:hypothetical protein